MAHMYSVRRGVTPWQALLDEVQSLAGQVAFLDLKIGGAAHVMGDAWLVGEGARWVEMRRDRGLLLAKVSKAAIDAGVAEAMLKAVELQGELMYRAAAEGLRDAVASLRLPLDEDQELAVVASIARRVVVLEEEEQRRQIAMATSLDGSVDERG